MLFSRMCVGGLLTVLAFFGELALSPSRVFFPFTILETFLKCKCGINLTVLSQPFAFIALWFSDQNYHSCTLPSVLLQTEPQILGIFPPRIVGRFSLKGLCMCHIRTSPLTNHTRSAQDELHWQLPTSGWSANARMQVKGWLIFLHTTNSRKYKQAKIGKSQ